MSRVKYLKTNARDNLIISWIIGINLNKYIEYLNNPDDNHSLNFHRIKFKFERKNDRQK